MGGRRALKRGAAMIDRDLSKPLAAPDTTDGTEDTIINIPSRPEFACASRILPPGSGERLAPTPSEPPALFNDWQLS
jgi:hypothetical protein